MKVANLGKNPGKNPGKLDWDKESHRESPSLPGLLTGTGTKNEYLIRTGTGIKNIT